MKANAVFSLLTSPHGRPVKGKGPPESGSAYRNLEFKTDWALNQRSSGECRLKRVAHIVTKWVKKLLHKTNDETEG